MVYWHVDAQLGTAEERNLRDKDENARVLERFRRDELDVLINVRMLTEGTHVPTLKTVFLTRQTTSSILMTQMVGRALRGPAFGGTDEAYIVAFIDDWKQAISWAEFGDLEGGIEESPPAFAARPPLQLISIDLVRRLARQMDSGQNIVLHFAFAARRHPGLPSTGAGHRRHRDHPAARDGVRRSEGALRALHRLPRRHRPVRLRRRGPVD